MYGNPNTRRLTRPTCRFCSAFLEHPFVDLGMSPLSQKHVEPDRLWEMEPFYPLQVWVCHACFLVQLEGVVSPEEIFGDGHYADFSSCSQAWLRHAEAYTDRMAQRFGIDERHRVVEVASNDGYLLQFFAKRGVSVLGIEPASICAAAALQKGVPSIQKFFGRRTAREVREEFGAADLLVGNNVLAHVPDLNDFVAGLAILLVKDGVLTLEFPHLMRLVERNQFDTIYHEHFSYFSFSTVERIFAHHGIVLFDVEELPTHGGSLRVYGRHVAREELVVERQVHELRERELRLGMNSLPYYARFSDRVTETKRRLLSFLIEARRSGESVVGYGAQGKGNTLLNYCGIRTDFLDYTVDRSPHEQGNYTPGTRIPILEPERIFETRPDYVLILPRYLEAEIVQQMAGIREWGGKFAVPIPELKIID